MTTAFGVSRAAVNSSLVYKSWTSSLCSPLEPSNDQAAGPLGRAFPLRKVRKSSCVDQSRTWQPNATKTVVFLTDVGAVVTGRLMPRNPGVTPAIRPGVVPLRVSSLTVGELDDHLLQLLPDRRRVLLLKSHKGGRVISAKGFRLPGTPGLKAFRAY